MTEDEFAKKVNPASKSVTFLWVAALVLLLACAAVIVGLWMSTKNDQNKSQMAVVTGVESGDVMGATTRDPEYLTNLAQNLAANGVVLYGFDGDRETKRQLAIFGQAITSLDYVECNSESAHANSDECVAKGVEDYPTWAKGDEKTVGFKSLEALEQMLVTR